MKRCEGVKGVKGVKDVKDAKRHCVKPTGCNPWALVLAFCAIGAQPVVAQDKLDPAALAKTIAPFIDEQAIVVGRADLTRVGLDPLLAKLGELFPDHKDVLPMAAAVATAGQQAFVKAGGRDVYAVFTLSPGSPVRAPMLFVPLRPGADENALRALFPPTELKTERVGDMLVAAQNQADLDWVHQIKPDPRPELAKAFEAVGDGAVQVLLLPPKYTQRVIEETMPQLPAVVGGGASSVFTRGVQWAAVGVDLPPSMALRVVIKSQDAQAAEAFRARWVELLRFAGQHKEVRQFVPTFDAVAKVLEPNAEGDRLLLVLNEKNNGIAGLLTILQPTVEQARTRARQLQSANNLKQIALAMLNFDDRQKHFPAAASYGANGKPLLSWRVLILPYLGEESLYKEFHLNEPWDSPHNKTLIAKMPVVYRSPMSKLTEPGRTNYVVAVGPGTVFSGREGIKLSEIKRGTSLTILTVEVADPQAVIWTKPDDLPYDPKDPAKGLGGLYKDGFNAVACDGAIHFIPLPQPAETLRNWFDPAGGRPLTSLP